MASQPSGSSQPTHGLPTDTSSSGIPIPSAGFDIRLPRHASAFDSSMRDLVGSPEDLSSLPNQSLTEYFTPHTPDDTPSPEDGNNQATFASAGPSRPGIHRSVTTPAGDTNGVRQRHFSLSTVTSHTPSKNSASQRRLDNGREWTVFGELMGQSQQDGNREPSYGSPLPRPAAREGIRDVLSLTIGRNHRPSPMDTSPPTPGPHSYRAMSPSSERSSSLARDDDSESSSTISAHQGRPDSTRSDSPVHNASESSQKQWFSLPTLTPVQRNILKCSIAYFIGSLFTFSPYLSGFIADLTGNGPGERRPSPSGHMVATM